jgi:hypothetical protein
MGWMIGSASLLFLASAGLELFVQQTFRQDSVATILLALALASWLKVLGLGGLLILSIWGFMKLSLGGTKRAASSRHSSAGSSSRDLEQPDLREAEYLSSRGVAPVVPRRSSREREDRNETNTRTKVA